MTFPPVLISGTHLWASPSQPLVAAETARLLADSGYPAGIADESTAPGGSLCVDVTGADDMDDLFFARGLDWARRGGLHLPVVVHGDWTSVGPLMTPGYSSCIQCADYRGIRDMASAVWPAEPPCDPATTELLSARLVAVTVAREVERIVRLDGALPATMGAVALVDHRTGRVTFANVSQVDGCESCSALFESFLLEQSR
ncbi:TOMM precursor leader peptide-binding protein [Streptacidiphilus sp. PAMC 29251]